MSPDPLWQSIVVQLLFLIVNFFFTMTETAVESTDDAPLKKQAESGDRRMQLLYRLLERPTGYLSALQLERLIVAGSLALGSGAALSLASTGSSVTAAPQDESEAAATRFLYVAGNLSNAGQLKLGGIGDVVRRFVFEVGGDVVLSGASKTAVYAARGVGDVAPIEGYR